MSAPLRHEALKELTERVARALPEYRDEQEAAVAREFEPLTDRIDHVLLRSAIDATNRRFVARMAGRAPADEDREAHVAFGAAFARAGLPFERVTAAYRLGARVSWHRMADEVRALGLGIDVVLDLAEAWLAYADDVAADSLEGFEREAAAMRGERARERQALVEALLAGRDARPLARAAGWRWPDLVVVAVPVGPVPPDAGGVLVGTIDGAGVVLVPGELVVDRVGPGLAAGPAVAPARAPVSLARARRVASLVAAGVLDPAGPLRWDDHLATLVVHADPAAGEALAARRLAPLDGLPAARRTMLVETLAAWLAHPGQPLAMARELHLHPQTVRYRLARLRERLGDALDDPAARFELGLALRVVAPRPGRPGA